MGTMSRLEKFGYWVGFEVFESGSVHDVIFCWMGLGIMSDLKWTR